MDKHGTILAQVISSLKLTQPNILDLGCGNGNQTKDIVKLVSATDVYGIDIDQTILREAENNGIKGIKANLNIDKLPFDDEYFDLVILSEVIEHLLNPDNALEEAYRVLKSGGVFVVTTPNLSSWMNRIYLLLGYQPPDMEVSTKVRVGNPWRKGALSGHIRPFTARAMKELLTHYGFNVKQIRGFPHENGSLPYLLYLLDLGFSKNYTLSHWNVFTCTRKK